MCSRQIFTKKCRQQQIFDSDLKGAWHYNHVTFTPIAKNFMLYCRLIYMLSILCVRLTIKVKVGIPESFKVGWYPPPPPPKKKKKLGRVTLTSFAGASSIERALNLRLFVMVCNLLWCVGTVKSRCAADAGFESCSAPIFFSLFLSFFCPFLFCFVVFL